MCGVCVSRATERAAQSPAAKSRAVFQSHTECALEKLDPDLTDLLHRHHRHARVGFSTPTSARDLHRLEQNRTNDRTRLLFLLRSHAATSSISFGCAAAYLASGAAWLARECSPQPAIAMRIIAPPRRLREDSQLQPSHSNLPGQPLNIASINSTRRSAMQFAEPQAVARRSVSSSLSPRSCATANPPTQRRRNQQGAIASGKVRRQKHR
jgi:hypothetical protein